MMCSVFRLVVRCCFSFRCHRSGFGVTYVHVETGVVAGVGIRYNHLLERSSSFFRPMLKARMGRDMAGRCQAQGCCSGGSK